MTNIANIAIISGMSQDDHLEPARTVITKAGGVRAVATITGKHVSRVYRWMDTKERGGTGGFIPPADAAKILQHAQNNGLDLTPGDFFAMPSPNTVEPA